MKDIFSSIIEFVMLMMIFGFIIMVVWNNYIAGFNKLPPMTFTNGMGIYFLKDILTYRPKND
jgi:hypothetical protein